MKTKYDPLDAEERELMEEIDSGEWHSVSTNKRQEILELSRNAAINSQTKSARMNIRLTESDMIELKVKATERGIPYQTLVTELIHEYVTHRK